MLLALIHILVFSTISVIMINTTNRLHECYIFTDQAPHNSTPIFLPCDAFNDLDAFCCTVLYYEVCALLQFTHVHWTCAPFQNAQFWKKMQIFKMFQHVKTQVQKVPKKTKNVFFIKIFHSSLLQYPLLTSALIPPLTHPLPMCARHAAACHILHRATWRRAELAF